MNTARAIAICKDLGNCIYSEREKARAIHSCIYGVLPAAAIDAEFATNIAKYLFERLYDIDYTER